MSIHKILKRNFNYKTTITIADTQLLQLLNSSTGVKLCICDVVVVKYTQTHQLLK